VTLVFANVAWCVITALTTGPNVAIYGASGAVTGVVVLFAFNFPNVTILFLFVIPMPAWVFGGLIVLNGYVRSNERGSDVAYVAHLAGAGFALAYHLQRWN